MNISVPFNFQPRPYQLDFLRRFEGVEGRDDTRKRRGFINWPRRAGKDKVCGCLLFKEAMRIRGNYFYVFPLATEARKAFWENIDKNQFKMLDHLPKECISRISNQDMLVETVNGSTVRLLGSDHDPDSIRGIATRGIVFSEVAYQDPQFYKVVMPAVRESEGWAIFNSTPNGRNHFYDMDVAVRNSPNWVYSRIQTLWPDRPHYYNIISPAEIQEIMSEEGLDQDDVEREFGTSYTTGMKGAYYAMHIERARDEGRIGNYGHDRSYPVDTFWDLGVRDQTVILFRQRVGNRRIFIDVYENSNQDLSHYVEILQEKKERHGYRYRTHHLPHDADRRSIHLPMYLTTVSIFENLCRDAGISSNTVIAPKLGVLEGIDVVRRSFNLYFFNEETTKTCVDKLSLYHKTYDPKRKVFSKYPAHDFTSHVADALRVEAVVEEPNTEHIEKERYCYTMDTEYDIYDRI